VSPAPRLPDEAVAAGAAAARPDVRRTATLSRLGRLGGTEGNELLTSAAAAVLTVLLAAEGITILQLGPLLDEHMLIGMALLPPVVLKLASTGYRFARYYTRSRPYRLKGPPALPLRLLAPVLVLATIGVFATGVWLLAIGHRSDRLLMLHKLFFIVWGAMFGIHFLAYLPRMARALWSQRAAVGHRAVPGGGWRGLAVGSSIALGAVLALSVVSLVTGWHGGHHHHHFH